MYHTYRDVHPQRSNIEPVVLKYSIGVRKFYASWVKTFLPLSPHSEYKLHRAFSTTAVSLSPRHLDGDLKGEVERAQFLHPSRRANYPLATVPVFQRNADPIDFGGFCKRVQEKKVYLFLSPTWITKRYISIFLKRGTVSSREYGTLCDTSAALRNVARWVSMSCHANDTCIPVEDVHVAKFEWCGEMIPRILWRVVTIFFDFKKLLRWLIIEESFFFLIDCTWSIFWMKIYIYIYL